ncbi:MAG: trypsin-like peptidase domain-containing protein [Fimbriimonadales bacterium]
MQLSVPFRLMFALLGGWLMALLHAQTPSVLDQAAREVGSVVERTRPAVVTVETVQLDNRLVRSSGFIVDSGGWVVCSAEGVQGARALRVLLSDGTAVPAQVVGVDAISGIALLRAPELGSRTSLRWGDPDRVPVGATVILIGNRGGLEGSVTVGTLGGKDRVGIRPQNQRVVLLLQFNGTVGSGEPGAPLLDARGQVIGVIIGALSNVEGVPASGLALTGFAIPSTIAQRVVNDLRLKGRAEHVWLGADYQTVGGAVVVRRVAPNSPAQNAGLLPNDLITGFNGQPIRSASDLTRALYYARPNQQVELVILREGKPLKLTVQLGVQSL